MRKMIFKRIILLISMINIYAETTGIPEIFISRNRWGARSSTAIEYSIIPIKYIIVHHTLTPSCSDIHKCSDLLKNIQNYHMNTLGFHDIGYNFLIGGDGNIYEGAGWHRVGAHTKTYNTRSIGLAFIGNYTSRLPNRKQLYAGKYFLKCGVEMGELDCRYKLLGARTISSTQSPGLALFHEIQNWKGFCKNP